MLLLRRGGRANFILFDYLVSAGNERGWYGEAERLSGFEIDDQLELDWLLHRQIGGAKMTVLIGLTNRHCCTMIC